MSEFLLFTSTLTPDLALALVGRNWRLLAKIVAVFAVMGVMYALLAPVEYTTESRLMPEYQAGTAANLKQFSALAELVGVNLEGASATEAIRPDLYPDVLTSTPFLLHTLNLSVTTANRKTYPTLVAFLTTANQVLPAWLPNDPLVMPKADSLGRSVRLTREQEDVLKDLRERIVATLDTQSGLIVIQVTMPDAEIAAQVCQQAIAYLRNYVVRYRTDKARENLDFVTHRRNEAKVRYDAALRMLSVYSDQNRFLYTQSARIESKRLETEYDLAQTVYSDLSRQYEQMRIKIQEQTPILSVLEPPKIAARRSQPRRWLIVGIATGIGLVVGICWIFGKAVWLLYRNDKRADEPELLYSELL